MSDNIMSTRLKWSDDGDGNYKSIPAGWNIKVKGCDKYVKNEIVVYWSDGAEYATIIPGSVEDAKLICEAHSSTDPRV